MALKPGSDNAELSMPADYDHDHPQERPEQWGWHGEFGRFGVIAGWVVIAIMLLFMTTTHYNGQGTLFLGLVAIGMFIANLAYMRSRKKAWRK